MYLVNQLKVDGADVRLSETQFFGYCAVVEDGLNVWITGGAGSGKSYLIKCIVAGLRKKGKVVAVVGPTGISAINAGGVTIHRWSGIGHEITLKKMLGKCDRRPYCNRWKSVDVIIIDEISLLPADILDNLEEVARCIRENDNFFGGIQLVLGGDFFQLLAFRKKYVGIGNKTRVSHERVDQAYLSQTFGRLDYYIQLAGSFRITDKILQKVLNQIRITEFTEDVLNILKRMVDINCMENNDLVKPTYLTSAVEEAQKINQKYFNKLKGPVQSFQSIDKRERGSVNEIKMTELLNDVQADKQLVLKERTQVMLTYNVSDKYCNGSRGIVAGFKKVNLNQLEKLKDSYDIKPYAWSVLMEYYKKRVNIVTITLPVVQFLDGTQRIIYPVAYTIESQSIKIVRVQIPLKYGWAITIHKAQSLSIDKVVIAAHVTKMAGQFYSAFGRGRSIKGIKLLSFDQTNITCDDDVRDFYEETFGSIDTNCVIRVEKEENIMKDDNKENDNVGRLKIHNNILNLLNSDSDASEEEDETMKESNDKAKVTIVTSSSKEILSEVPIHVSFKINDEVTALQKKGVDKKSKTKVKRFHGKVVTEKYYDQKWDKDVVDIKIDNFDDCNRTGISTFKQKDVRPWPVDSVSMKRKRYDEDEDDLESKKKKRKVDIEEPLLELY